MLYGYIPIFFFPFYISPLDPAPLGSQVIGLPPPIYIYFIRLHFCGLWAILEGFRNWATCTASRYETSSYSSVRYLPNWNSSWTPSSSLPRPGSQGTRVLHVVVIRPLTTRSWEDGGLFLSERFPMIRLLLSSYLAKRALKSVLLALSISAHASLGQFLSARTTIAFSCNLNIQMRLYRILLLSLTRKTKAGAQRGRPAEVKFPTVLLVHCNHNTYITLNVLYYTVLS